MKKTSLLKEDGINIPRWLRCITVGRLIALLESRPLGRSTSTWWPATSLCGTSSTAVSSSISVIESTPTPWAAAWCTTATKTAFVSVSTSFNKLIQIVIMLLLKYTLTRISGLLVLRCDPYRRVRGNCLPILDLPC